MDMFILMYTAIKFRVKDNAELLRKVKEKYQRMSVTTAMGYNCFEIRPYSIEY